MRFFSLVQWRALVLVVLVLRSAPGGAQVTVVTDVSGGISVGSGSGQAVMVPGVDGINHRGPSFDVMLSVQRAPREGPFLALVGAVEGGGTKNMCIIAPSGCATYALSFASLSVLAGYRGDFGSNALRGAAGIGYYGDIDNYVSVGFQGRVHADIPANAPIALSLAARGTWLPNHRRAGYGLTAAMLGLRLRLFQR